MRIDFNSARKRLLAKAVPSEGPKTDRERISFRISATPMDPIQDVALLKVLDSLAAVPSDRISGSINREMGRDRPSILKPSGWPHFDVPDFWIDLERA